MKRLKIVYFVFYLQDKRFIYLVYIGRFQPFHSGHLYVLKEALKKAKKVIVLIGSANQPRSNHNRWLWQEREAMIRSCLDESEANRVICMPLEDVPTTIANNNDVWVNNVKGIVKSVAFQHGPGLCVGYEKMAWCKAFGL